MKIDIPKIGEPVLHTYKYDQLNRIKEVNNYNSYNAGTNTWSATNAHKELLSFDGNGNIQTALLNGSSASLPYENFVYTYDGVKKNRLLSIHNSVGNVTSEYEYDAMGNVTKDELEGNENMEWNVYGKLKSLEKIGSGTAISFGYDASGNRISKKVGTTKQKWYVRDASGNIMATYIKEDAVNSGDLSTEMFSMYGSSMLGGWKLSVNMETMPPPPNAGELERGNQEFYFSNHLGNNLVILSDRKEGIQDTGNPTQVTGYEPDVLSATDYSAYGENLIGREYNPGKIKFGFNGKWNDFETGYQDYGMRMSSRKRRGFVSVDPITAFYPTLTPYQFASNSPLFGIDFDGLELTLPRIGSWSIPRPILTLPKLPTPPTAPVPPLPPPVPSFPNFPINPSLPSPPTTIPGPPVAPGLTRVAGNIDWTNPPSSPSDLGEGWQETTDPRNQSGNNRNFRNKETGEEIRFDKGNPQKGGNQKSDHWHRLNPDWEKSMGNKGRYLDRKGNPVDRNSEASHIKAGNNSFTSGFIDKVRSFVSKYLEFRKFEIEKEKYDKAIKQYEVDLKKYKKAKSEYDKKYKEAVQNGQIKEL